MNYDSEHIALMRMLVRRATLMDHYRAWRKKGHWLNSFRREIAIAGRPLWARYV